MTKKNMFDYHFVSYLLFNIGLRENKTQLFVEKSSLFITLFFSLFDGGIVKKKMCKEERKKSIFNVLGNDNVHVFQ